jgi:DNA-directed RNA polymerase specialized sigma24 family protein
VTTGAEGGRPRPVNASRADQTGTQFDRKMVSEAMKQLSPSHRVMIREAHFRGQTTGDIAAELNLTDAVVKNEMHEALRTLHRTLTAMAERCDPAPDGPRSGDQSGAV